MQKRKEHFIDFLHYWENKMLSKQTKGPFSEHWTGLYKVDSEWREGREILGLTLKKPKGVGAASRVSVEE